MQRLIEMLGRADYRVIVSMGPQHQEIRLAPNMRGAEFLPQTSVLPLVDLVSTESELIGSIKGLLGDQRLHTPPEADVGAPSGTPGYAPGGRPDPAPGGEPAAGRRTKLTPLAADYSEAGSTLP